MLKEFFGDIFGFSAEINRLQNLITDIGDGVDYWHEKYEKTAKDLEKAESDYLSLKDEFDEWNKPIEIPLAEITYRRPVLVSEKTYKIVQIDVRSFIMPDFYMEKELKKKNLIYDETQDLDELFPKIYHLAKTGYKYGPDKDYGFNEYVMFPFELKAALESGKAGDCDDWANLIGSYFAAANLPRTNWLIAYGEARAGYGHATVYVKDSTGVWRHLNSTKPEYASKHLSGYPSSKDEGDKVGIKTDGYWFSYNDRFAFHKFETKEAKNAFIESELKIEIKVKK